MAKTFDKQMATTKVMIDGLKGRSELPVGITAQMIKEVEDLLSATVALNSEQEKLKAHLKAKTAEVEKSTKTLGEKALLMKNYIKLNIPKELWKEFGIEDKK